MSTRRTGAVLVAVAALLAAATPATAAAPTATVLNVKSYGAKGDGSANDTAAINRAIVAANQAPGGGTVQFPAGTYRSANTIHMLSDVTLRLDAGSTIKGSGADTYDRPEPNPNDQYQDYGHSHFHNAMIHGDRLTNIGFVGAGTIDGGGNLITGNPKAGEADKILSLTRCDGLNLSGITLRRGGHFAALINGCDHVTSDRLTIDTAGDRDGWNIISTRNVVITNIHAAANDDALVFKSDYALGQKLPNGNVTVDTARLSAGCCNALMFGSETCGDFTHYRFSHVTITGAGKSGLGLVSMDGARISDVRYDDVMMSNTASPIMLKIGTRKRCGDGPGIGSISDVHFGNVRGTSAGAYSPTIWGQPGHPVSDVSFDHVDLTVPGGHDAMDPTKVPTDTGDYNPKSLGTRPAYGWYLHEVSGVSFTDSSVRFAADDGRPAVIANAGTGVTFTRFTVQRGAGSPFDLGFQHISGYCATAATTTTGAPARVTATGSSPTCG
ncbi:glycosyl hydrolase family 28 protein [Longispora sp. K20-0274]|uniref:glycoside hydrolase family 28 protein n=1 Tax=Longispora sp. K20-0274 TaxID=3088255 RepID=UPI00399AA769